jgi:outer membrane protein TolC
MSLTAARHRSSLPIAVVFLGAAASLPATAEVPTDSPIRLTLAEAIERARETAPRLRELRSLEAAAGAGVDAAHGARLPQLDLSAGYTRQSHVPELTGFIPGEGVVTLFPDLPDNYALRLGVSVPLYTGGRLSGQIEAAEEQLAASASDVEAGEADMVLETTLAYWDLALSRSREKVLRQAVASYEVHQKEAQDRLAVGMAARHEVLQVQVSRDRAELARLEAANEAAVAAANLARLLDFPPESALEAIDPLDDLPAPPGEREALRATALAARPERAAVAARLQAAEARAKAERGDLWPQVRAGAGYDLSDPNRRILPPEAGFEDTWEVSLGVAFNLYDGGIRRAELARAMAEADALRHHLDDLDRAILLQVETSALALDSARAGTSVAANALVAAQESERVAGDRFRAGLIPSSERLDAETALLFAGLDRATTQARAQMAAARRARAVGN